MYFRMCVSARQNFGGRTEWVDAPAKFLVLAGCCGDDDGGRHRIEDGRGRGASPTMNANIDLDTEHVPLPIATSVNTNREIRKIAYRSRNRLLSIHRDSRDLKPRVLSALRHAPNTPVNAIIDGGKADGWPWLPNKHCGSWYLPPAEWDAISTSTNNTINAIQGAEVYFQSTDGHMGTYAMSLKRLNLPLIELLHIHGGCILVDSSVRKLLPDSFSRTIPIWCAVMNRIALKYRADLGLTSPSLYANDNDEWDIALHTPSSIVSPEEYLEITNLIDARVELLYQSRAIVDIHRFVEIMTKPIRAIWVANGSVQYDTISSISHPLSIEVDKYFTIVCCNPSHYNTDGGRHHVQKIDNDNYDNGCDNDNAPDAFNQQSYYYMPGAADDEDAWSRNLSPELFWKNRNKILDPTLTEDETDAIIDTIIHDLQLQPPINSKGSIDDETLSISDADRIGDMNLWIGSRSAGRSPACWERFDAILTVEYRDMYQSIEEEAQSQITPSCYYLQLPVEEGKRDKHELEKWMPVGLVFIVLHLQQNRLVLVHSAKGRDHSVAIVLAFVALYCAPTYPLRLKPEFNDIDFGDITSDSEEHAPHNHQRYLRSGIYESIVQNLLQDGGKEHFLSWMHTTWQQSNPVIEPFAGKESLRVALHLVKKDRENAEPTRSTMQKLNRFFMSSPLYRSERKNERM